MKKEVKCVLFDDYLCYGEKLNSKKWETALQHREPSMVSDDLERWHQGLEEGSRGRGHIYNYD